MKTAFIFDTVLVTPNKKQYYARTLHYDLWNSRYSPFFGEMNIVTRAKVEEEAAIKSNPMLQLVNGDRVKVEPIFEYKEVPDAITKEKNIKKKIATIIDESDFVIIRMPSVLGTIASNICNKMNKPYLVEMVADPWDSYFYHTKKAGKLIAPVMYFATKRVAKKSNNILYVTNDFLQKRYPSKGENRIGLSDVIVSPLNEKIAENNIKKRLENIRKKKIRFGIVGNYDLRTKGQFLAIRSLANLENQFSSVSLELVGAGDENFLAKTIKENNADRIVKFLGTKKSGDEIFEWMDTLDILLVPSFQEGLPRVVVEAMSRGVLVIGSTAGGIYELLPESCIFQKGKASDLEKILKKILDGDFEESILIENYHKSSRFEKKILDERRNGFYSTILRGVKICSR